MPLIHSNGHICWLGLNHFRNRGSWINQPPAFAHIDLVSLYWSCKFSILNGESHWVTLSRRRSVSALWWALNSRFALSRSFWISSNWTIVARLSMRCLWRLKFSLKCCIFTVNPLQVAWNNCFHTEKVRVIATNVYGYGRDSAYICVWNA